MKRQYLGDSRDSFKWDYHHHLATELRAPALHIVWMMTADDNSGEGQTRPELFPARSGILTFCRELHDCRDPRAVARLPATTGASYKVHLYGTDREFVNRERSDYFSEFDPLPGVIFLDPDNGFEPDRICTEKHVRYSDVDALLKRASPNSVFTVFQHFRRRPFTEDFSRIKERLLSGYATAIYWHSLMFVSVSKTEAMRDRVVRANLAYAKDRHVQVLA